MCTNLNGKIFQIIINMNVIPFTPIGHFIKYVTYLEWVAITLLYVVFNVTSFVYLGQS